ncbi:MAG TPA: hypothetical protein VKB75_04105 [Jatrophihabitans sp.]|nr:hypothetical protein [Jatrophihabitans sp.]
MTVAVRRAAVGLSIAAALAVGACSSSGKKAPSSSPPAGSTSSIASSTAGGGEQLSAAARQQISRAYEQFFDSKTPLNTSVAALQHGSVFRSAVDQEGNTQVAQGVTAKVTATHAQSADVAAVTFSLLSAGRPLLADTHGYAVLEGGKWKVAAQTFCSLLTLNGNPPKACSNPAITALPK